MVRQGLKGLPALALLALLFTLGCANHVAPAPVAAGKGPSAASEPPPAPREFRGVWVATVANIDWPSARGLPVEAQQAEAREIITRARSLGLNAIVFQVRPAADAMYASSLEPWSEYLTGEQGQPPTPSYDPLAFWVEEAHRAGLELHAWFNPYRARHATAKSPLSPDHVGITQPNIVKTYGDQLWLDPGEPGAAGHVLAVMLDVVRRYDIDGVHIDDYFYPYPIKDAAGQKVDFPDGPAWEAYLTRSGALSRADWRRSNVDQLVERLYREIHSEKPQVRVGISPFGLGRPDRRPAGISGFSQYDEIYANVELWLERGWLDYLAPQLYWKVAASGQPFRPLLDYWRAQNTQARHVWPGLFTSRTGGTDPWPVAEITEQIQLARTPGGSLGHVHFSMVALKKNWGGIADALAGSYADPALVPASPWLKGTAPVAPSVSLKKTAADASAVTVETAPGQTPWLLALWARYGSTWRFFTLPGGAGRIPALSGADPLGPVVVSAVERSGLESPRVPAVDQRY